MAIKIGLQLYSVKEEIEKDYIKTLEKVKAIGYDCVEFAGFGDFSAQDLKKELDRIGLEPYSAHIGFEQLRDKMDETVKYVSELGLSWVICPGHKMETSDDVAELAALLKELSGKLTPLGIRTGYHNHSHEFNNKVNGVCTMDLLVDATKGEAVYFEIDTCWAGYADVDPVAYIKNLKKRAGPVHFKDLNQDYKQMSAHDINAEVGTGVIDFSGVINVMKENGVYEHGAIVEQEGSSTDIWNSVTICYNNIRKIDQ